MTPHLRTPGIYPTFATRPMRYRRFVRSQPVRDMAAVPDATMVERIRTGDTAAFTALFREMFPALRVYLFHLTGSGAVAEELAQDLFITLWEGRGQLAVHTALSGYLFTAARNAALNYIKHERVIDRWAQYVRASSEPTAPSADQGLDDAEVMRAAVAAINQLPERCRQIFLLHRTSGRTYGEIAAELGISVKTVETQMTRALVALRAALSAFLP